MEQACPAGVPWRHAVSDQTISPHDAGELAACFAAHARGLFGYACVLARGDQALADDLVQAAFEAAGRSWQSLRYLAEEQRRGWLRTTLASIAMRAFRREAAFRDPIPNIEARYRRAQANPREQAFPPVVLERCWQVIQGMPERQHAVALLHWHQGMKESEIADALGMPEKTVSAHLRQARRKLIAQLGPDFPFTGENPGGASS